MNLDRQIQILGEKVVLRCHREGDAPLLYEAARESVEHMVPWMPWCHAGYALAESEEWMQRSLAAWERDDEYNFVITDSTTGRFLGGCALNKIDREYQSANLGYWTRTSALGKGYAVEATRLLARFGFEKLGLIRIEIVAAVKNTASQRVAIKAGAVREGTARKRLLLHGAPADAYVYSIVLEDLLDD